MAQRAIREVDGKRLLSQWLPEAWENSDATPISSFQTHKPFTVTGTPAWDALAATSVSEPGSGDRGPPP